MKIRVHRGTQEIGGTCIELDQMGGAAWGTAYQAPVRPVGLLAPAAGLYPIGDANEGTVIAAGRRRVLQDMLRRPARCR